MTTRRHIENTPEGFLDHLEEHHSSEQDALLALWQLCGEYRHDVHAEIEVDSLRKSEIRATVLDAATSNRSRYTRPPVRVFRLREFAVAASIALLVVIGFIFSSQTITHRAPVGEQALSAVNLPDGSSVVLAAGSVLSYADSFGDNDRRLTLKGEAFFDVVASDIPFQIDTYNARTTVHGTRFSVRAWANDIDPATDVIVEEGRVSVMSRWTGSWDLVVEAGDQLSVEKRGESTPELIGDQTEASFSWLVGGYAYKNEPIGNVVEDLKRQYDVSIEAPTSIELRPISIFNQSKSSLEDVLGDISAAVGIKYRAISGGYELYED